ncbi:hypothetical protein [Mesorhizobium sp. 10J20-29]
MTENLSSLDEMRSVDALVKSIRDELEEGRVKKALDIFEENSEKISSVISAEKKNAKLKREAALDMLRYLRKGIKEKTAEEIMEISEKALRDIKVREFHIDNINENMDFILDVVQNYEKNS